MSTTVPELLERERELAVLAQLLEQTDSGAGGVAVVEGEAGAGKTALLLATTERAASNGMQVLRARGGEYERDFPYGVVRQLFEPTLRDPGRRAELLTGGAALAGSVFEPGADSVEAGAVEHGLYWLAAGIAEAAPLVLAVDDAQWADVASLRALAYLARRLDGVPAALLLTVRSGEPGVREDLLDELRREAAESIQPPPLSAAAAAALVASETGGKRARGDGEALREATGGNPFLLGELARALAGAGPEGASEGGDELAAVAAAGVGDSIRARLTRLGEAAVEVARAVAVLEPNAQLGAVGSLTGLGPEAVTAATEQLIGARLLSDESAPGFVHPLVREAVLAELPAPRRAALHGRAARLLDEAGAESDAVAAQILLAAPVGDAWVAGELRSAAAAALGRGAPEAAVRYLRRALREPPPAAQRFEFSRALGEALLRADDPEGIEILHTVRAGAEDPVTRAELAIAIGGSLGVRAGGERAAGLLEESLAELADPSARLALHLRAFLLLQMIWGLERVPPGALPEPGELVPTDLMEGRVVLQAAACLYAFGLGTVERGLELAEAVLAAGEAAVRADALAGFPPQGLALALAGCDRGEAVDSLLGMAIEAGRERGSVLAIHGALSVRSICRFLDGELGEAQADAAAAIPYLSGADLWAALSVAVAIAVRAGVARGETAEAEALLERCWQGRNPLPGAAGALLLCARAELRQARGRHAEARHDYLAAGGRLREIPYPNPEHFPWRTGLAACEMALGNVAEARRLAAEALALARQAGGARGVGVCLRVEGEVSEGEEAIELLREAAQELAGTRARLQHARALLALGAALRRANLRREAREPLREALELAHRCGAAPLEERARTELAATGARPRSAVLSGVESLTPSELRVARLAADGMTNREIAQDLTVTKKTVETHMRHVFQKLDLKARAELAAALDERP